MNDSTQSTEAPRAWTGRADYADRREARIERLHDAADRHAEASAAAFGRAHAAVAGIPLGQPNIGGKLTPCYKRHDAAIRASIREDDKADHYAHAAEAAEHNRAISSDDPEAITKLKAKLAALEALQEKMKIVNKALRINDTDKGNAELAKLGYTPQDIAKFRTPDFCGRIGYPSYALTNNNATIRNVKARIEQLERLSEAPAPEGWQIDGGEVICNVDENRIQIRFNEIPDEAVRQRLKSNGFRWSRWGGVWQRQLTPRAISTTRYLFPAKAA